MRATRLASLSGVAAVAALAVTGWLAPSGGQGATYPEMTHGASVPGTVDVGVAGTISASAFDALTEAAALTHTSVNQLAADLVFQGWRLWLRLIAAAPPAVPPGIRAAGRSLRPPDRQLTPAPQRYVASCIGPGRPVLTSVQCDSTHRTRGSGLAGETGSTNSRT